ncbi:MAG: helix-turn-helix transcriptional regulator [Clostridia bacterium]|nr:helix-turn-helix transcriptional regulator [Clostridia bacterium]
MKNYFPERFTEVIKDSNLNYEQIAMKLGLKSKGTISKYANGNIDVSVSMIIKIAELFDVSPIWLLGFTNNKHYVIKD